MPGYPSPSHLPGSLPDPRSCQRRRQSIGLTVCLLSLLLAGSLAADDSHPHNQLLKGHDRLTARDAYLNHCAACHGEAGDGQGGTAVPDLTTPAAVVTYDRQRMIRAGLRGHAAAVRARWSAELDADALTQVVDYMREAFMLPAPLADASLGRRIYARTCSVCHGERGDGASWAQNSLNPPPRDFTALESLKLSRREMINAVIYGSPGSAMMPFTAQFTDHEIAAVVDYIRQAFQSAGRPPVHQGHGGGADIAGLVPRGPAHGTDSAVQNHHPAGEAGLDAAFPADLIGRAEQGQRFYDRNCAECHGTKGDGQGPRAYFMTRKPRDFTSDKARAELNRPHLFEAISKGVTRTEMAAWSKVLDDQQIADVAEYVFNAFIMVDSHDGSDSHARPASTSNHAPQGAKKN